MKAKTLLSVAVSGVLMAAAATSVQATTFYYNAYGGWINGSAVGFPNPTYQGTEASGSLLPGNQPQNLPAGLNNDLIWGSPLGGGTGGPFAGRSGAGINDNLPAGTGIGHMVKGTLVVGDTQPVLLGTLTHYNEPINEAFQGTAKVNYTMDLYSDLARTNFIASLTSTPFGEFLINFTETPNQPPCPAGSVSTCDDIFSFGPASATDSFTYLGQNYNVTLSGFYDSLSLQNLTGQFLSPEGGSNVGFVGVVSVPEPATLALMGLGLLGMGLSVRRRKQPEMV